jgi:hypothetical protein
VLQQLYDPATTAASARCNGGAANPYCRTPFQRNQIPQSRESPTTKIFNDITPLPTNSNNPTVTSNLSGVDPSDQILPTITFRLDHELNQANRAYLRYTNTTSTNLGLRNDPVNEPVSLAADGLPAAASGTVTYPTSLYAAAVGFTHVFSPAFYSETIASQQWFGESTVAGGAPFTDYEQPLVCCPRNTSA